METATVKEQQSTFAARLEMLESHGVRTYHNGIEWLVVSYFTKDGETGEEAVPMSTLPTIKAVREYLGY